MIGLSDSSKKTPKAKPSKDGNGGRDRSKQKRGCKGLLLFPFFF
jgi:hypothetical protein